MEIVALSIGRGILDPGSREYERMRQYALHVEGLHIVVLARREHGEHDEIHNGALHVYPTHARTRIGMLIAAGRIAFRLVRSFSGRETVVTAQDPFAIGLLAFVLARSTSVRFHVQLHGDYWGSAWGQESLVSRLQVSLKKILARYLLMRADGVRVVSERIKKSLIREGLAKAPITVLPIRPELEEFLKVDHDRAPHEYKRFLIASRFSKEKNIPLMVRAFRRAQERNPRMSLTIAGRGGEADLIQRTVKVHRVEHVTFLPWITDMPHQYSETDVFLLGSLHEAYGLTLIEALASGVPVITTDVGCVGELVRDGEHGIVVPVNDEDAYVDALVRMSTDTAFREACGNAGRLLGQRLRETTPESYAKKWVAAHSCRLEGV